MRKKQKKFYTLKHKKMEIKELLKNQKAIIAEKKKAAKRSHAAFVHVSRQNPVAYKMQGPGKEGEYLNVKVVGNMCNYIDDENDMVLENAFGSTFDNPKAIKMLHDHSIEVTGMIGTTEKIYYESFDAAKFWPTTTKRECKGLVIEGKVRKDYNYKVFKMYENGDINQHSVSFYYDDVKLAVKTDDPEFSENFENWNKYLSLAINPEVAEQAGYFYVVEKAVLMENSAVLWGSNNATPTLQVTKPEPQRDTQKTGKTNSFLSKLFEHYEN